MKFDAFDSRSGKVVWQYTTRKHDGPTAAAVIADGYVAFNTEVLRVGI